MVTMQCSKPALMQMFPVYLVTFEFSPPRCVGRPLCATGIKRCVSNDVKCPVCVALNNWIVCSILIYRPQGENRRKKNVSFKITGKLKKSRVGISLRPRQVWTEVDLKSCIEDQNPALTQTPEKLKVKVFLALLRCLVYASQRLLAHSLGLLPLNH